MIAVRIANMQNEFLYKVWCGEPSVEELENMPRDDRRKR